MSNKKKVSPGVFSITTLRFDPTRSPSLSLSLSLSLAPVRCSQLSIRGRSGRRSFKLQRSRRRRWWRLGEDGTRRVRRGRPPPLVYFHAWKHGRVEAPGDDKSVRSGRRLCGGPGEAAFTGGSLAVRDGAQRLLPGKQHSVQPPPPNDVHSSQHPSNTSQLPRHARHVLSPQDHGGLQRH